MNKNTELNETLPTLPNAKYQKLFASFAEIETLPIAQWKVCHILGYFVKKFKEAFGVEYKFKFNNPLPNKSFEVWQVKALSSKLSSNPETLKNYIDWFYQETAASKKRFTSISAITKDEMTNKYKWEVLPIPKSALSLDRMSLLSQQYQDILTDAGITSTTYGSLSFLYQINKDAPSTSNFKKALEALVLAGFDTSILDKIV